MGGFALSVEIGLILCSENVGAMCSQVIMPCVCVCSYIFYVTPRGSWLAAGVMVYVGMVVFVCVYLLRGSHPDYFQQIATHVPALLETPACSRLNTPAPSVHGQAWELSSEGLGLRGKG